MIIMINTNFVTKGRGAGKTTGLIYASEATGYPIVLDTMVSTVCIEEKAKEMGCKIPKPICARDLINRKKFIHCPVLIDEGKFLISQALESYLGVPVAAVTFTPDD
jgi:hypothetical protein